MQAHALGVLAAKDTGRQVATWSAESGTRSRAREPAMAKALPTSASPGLLSLSLLLSDSDLPPGPAHRPLLDAIEEQLLLCFTILIIVTRH